MKFFAESARQSESEREEGVREGRGGRERESERVWGGCGV
jgi:hypothetical protein